MKNKIYISLIIILILLISIMTYLKQKNNKKQNIPILLYHHILSEEENTKYKDNSCVVSLEYFEEQMKYLYDNDFYTITIEELNDFIYNSKPLPKNSIMINFDDGYTSNIERAYPILQKYGFKAQIFLITSLTTDEKTEFDPDRLIFIDKDSINATTDVFEYASHTHDMHKLEDETSTGLVLESKEIIVNDIEKSFEYVTNTEMLAYPRGQYNDTTIEALKQCGIKTAVTVNPGYVNNKDNPYELNRFIIYPTTDFKTFKDIVDGNYK